jgi:uncharacterized membrane protein YgcG
LKLIDKMSNKFELRLAQKSRACPKCKKSMEKGSVQLGIAANFGDHYGSMMWRRVGCVDKSQIIGLESNWSGIEGFSDLNEEQQEEVKTALEAVLVKEKGTKKRKAPLSEKKKKAPAKKKEGEPKEKKQKKKKDPNEPKRALSSYMLFCADIREEVKAENPEAKITELSKLMGAKWKEISKEGKTKYEALNKEFKELYTKQMKEFSETGTYTRTEAQKAHEEKQEAAKLLQRAKAKAKAAERPKKPRKKVSPKKKAKQADSGSSGSGSDSGSASGSGSSSDSGSGSSSGSDSDSAAAKKQKVEVEEGSEKNDQDDEEEGNVASEGN